MCLNCCTVFVLRNRSETLVSFGFVFDLLVVLGVCCCFLVLILFFLPDL